MVVFDELRIDNKGEYLYIRAHLRKDLRKDATRIDKIWVCDSSKYTEGSVPSGAQKVYQYDASLGHSKWSVDLKINPSGEFTDRGQEIYDNLDPTFMGKLLFVYAEVVSSEELSASCDCASNPAIGVALDMGIIYRQFMKYIDELSCRDKCTSNIPQGFTDFILRFNALLLAMDSKHYKKGIEFFNNWFSKGVNSFKKDCGCNG